MDSTDGTAATLDDSTGVTKNYLNDKIALLNNKILDLKLGMRLIEMESNSLREELKDETKQLRRLNKMLLGFVIIFEICLLVALR